MDIKKLIGMVSESDAVRLKILHNAVAKNMRTYNSAPTEANRRNWEASENALKEAIADATSTINPEKKQEDFFETKLDAWRFLRADGWNISRSRFYDHCRDGLLRPDPATGQYKLSAVERYAKLHVRLEATGAKVNEKLDKMQEEKLETELAREKVRLEREIHDLKIKQKKFVPAAEFELAIVARAVAFMAHLNHAVQSNVPDWIDLVEGDQNRSAELVQAVSGVIEQRMSDFAAEAEFEIFLEAN